MNAKKRKKKSKSVFSFFTALTNRHIIIVLGVVSFLLYVNTLGHDFVLDDAIVITENVLTEKGVAAIPDLLTHDSFFGFFQVEGKDQLVQGGRYRPLSLILFAFLYQLFGSTPFVFHFVNVLLFAFCSILTYRLLHSLLSKVVKGENARFLSFSAALLFAVHPIHTEVVANVKSADELLSYLLSVGAMILVFKSSKASTRDWVLAGLLFFMALLAKEIAATFIGIAYCTILLLRSASFKTHLTKLLPFMVSFGAYLFLRIAVLGLDVGGSTPPRELMNNPFLKLVDGQYMDMTTMEKWPMIIQGLGMYIKLIFLPYPLTHDYYPRHPDIVDWADWQVLISLALLIISVLLVVRFWRSRPIPVYGLLIFFGGLFLTSNILFPIGTNLSERFLFVPSLGWCIGMAWIATEMIKSGRKVPTFILLGIVIIAFSVITVTRNPTWKNNYRLFTTDAETSWKSAKVQNAAGGALIAQAMTVSDTTVRNQNLRLATRHLDQAIQIHPLYKNAYLLLGNAHYYLERYETAITYYNKALQLDGGYEEAVNNRAYAYRDYGRFLGETRGDIAMAMTFLQNAVEVLQDDYETNRLLGVAYGNNGQPANAIKYFEKALEQEPNNAWINFNLGQAYRAIGDSVNANRYISIAKALNPEIGR